MRWEKGEERTQEEMKRKKKSRREEEGQQTKESKRKKDSEWQEECGSGISGDSLHQRNLDIQLLFFPWRKRERGGKKLRKE
jgi:hypothetical protein